MVRVSGRFDIEITYRLGKVNIVFDSLSSRQVMCGARLTTMGIIYEDQ